MQKCRTSSVTGLLYRSHVALHYGALEPRYRERARDRWRERGRRDTREAVARSVLALGARCSWERESSLVNVSSLSESFSLLPPSLLYPQTPLIEAQQGRKALPPPTAATTPTQPSASSSASPSHCLKVVCQWVEEAPRRLSKLLRARSSTPHCTTQNK